MTCDEAKPLFSAYLAEEVAGRQKTQLKKHLQGCQDCCALLAELRKTTSPSKERPKEKPAQDSTAQAARKTKRFKPALVTSVILWIASLAVYLVISPSPSNRPIPEFRLLSEKPARAEKAIRDLVELLDGTILPKKETGQIAASATPTAAGIAEEDILLISIPIKAQDFFLEKLRAFGTLEPVSSTGQPSSDKRDDPSMVTLRLTIGAPSPASQLK